MVSQREYAEFKSKFAGKPPETFGREFITKYGDRIARTPAFSKIFYCSNRARAEQMIEENYIAR